MPVTAAGVGITRTGTLLGLRMEIAGAEVLQVTLSRYADRVTDFRRFWREYFAPVFFQAVQRNFETEGAYVGKWAPLTPVYAAWKAAHFPGRGLLVRTGRLLASLAYDNESIGPEGIFVAERDFTVLGTRVPYATYHQRGTRRMAMRRVLFFTREAGSVYGRLLHNFAADEVRLAGFRAAAARVTPSSRFL